MYRYDQFDETLVRERARQFRGQVERRIEGSLTEDEFRPLRLMNGLYLQLHAYMLRVAIPYGTLNSRQMRQLAAEGCNVAMCDVSAENMAETKRLCQSNAPQGTRVMTFVADVSSEEQILKFRDAVARAATATANPTAGRSPAPPRR